MKLTGIIITIVSLLISYTAAYSLDVNLGVNMWYSAWQPDFEDSFRGEGNGISEYPGNGPAYNDSFEVEPCLMAGPVVSLRFSDRLSLGLVFLVSLEATVKSSFNVFHDDTYDDYDFTFTQRNDMTFRRYDGDLTLSFRIAGPLSLFGGVKYLRWDGAGDIDITTSGSDLYSYTSHTDSDVTGQCLGPALGISISQPLIGMMFVTASGSAMYLRCYDEQTLSVEDSAGKSETTNTDGFSNYLGFNAAAGLGYFFSSFDTTLILGGRYQYLKETDNQSDSFYGVTLSAMYSF